MIKYVDCVWANSFPKYGKALKVRRSALIALFIITCLVTPGTNWLIPASTKLIKKDITFRWGQ